MNGYFGQSIYNSANCFLDSFATWLSTRNYPALSINWDAWKEKGMAHQTKLLPFYDDPMEKAYSLGIKESEGMQLFPILLRSSLSQLIVSTTNLDDKFRLFNSVSQKGQKPAGSVQDIGPKIERVWKEGLQSVNPKISVYGLQSPNLNTLKNLCLPMMLGR